MTRAKDHTSSDGSQRFYTHGQRSTGARHVYAQRTRFISNAMLAQFETCSWPNPNSATNSGDRLARNPADVRAKMRRMWGLAMEKPNLQWPKS